MSGNENESPVSARRWARLVLGATAVAVTLGAAGCALVADLDGYDFDRGDQGIDPGPVDVTVTAGGADMVGTHYRMTIRVGAPQPSRTSTGSSYTLSVGPGAVR